MENGPARCAGTRGRRLLTHPQVLWMEDTTQNTRKAALSGNGPIAHQSRGSVGCAGTKSLVYGVPSGTPSRTLLLGGFKSKQAAKQRRLLRNVRCASEDGF